MASVARCAVMDGVLVVNKEAGWTSHDVVAKVRHLLGGTKVGHAGTLDPAATGVLPLLIGKAARIAEYLVEWDKEYRAVLRLGETTDTQDATGTVLSRRAVDGVTPQAIYSAVEGFRGSIKQVPPMYSAVKVNGVPLYKSARAGKTVERKARTVCIHALEILAIDGRDVTLRAICSKGTYVRTLCADIGRALSVGGHLLSLERRRVGLLTIDQALTVDEVIRRHTLGSLAEAMQPIDRMLHALPAVVVDNETAARVCHGVPVPLSKIAHRESACEEALQPGAAIRIHDAAGSLLAIGRYPDEKEASMAVEKVLVSQE